MTDSVTPQSSTPPEAPPPRRRRSRAVARRLQRWAIMALLLLAGAALAVHRVQNPPLPEVTVAAVTEGPLTADWAAAGYVEARTAEVSAPAVGRVLSVEVREGDPVRAGQILARLDTHTEVAAIESRRQGEDVARAEAAAADAAVKENARVLADRVAAAESELDAARARVREAEAAVEREERIATARLRAAKAEAQAAAQQLRELENGPRREEIQQAEAALADAIAVRQRARIERDRQEVLVREKAAARRALEDAEEALTRAEAQVKRAEAALALLRQGTRPETIAAAQARLRAAEENVAAAEAEVAGVNVAERRVEQMRAAAGTAEAALAEARSAQARVQTLDKQAQAARTRIIQATASTQEARALLSDKVVYAPFNGTIGRRLADPGDLATPGQSLFTVVESDRSWIEAEVDEQDLAAVRLGQQVSISVPSLPGQTFSGLIERIGTQALPQLEQTRTSARIVRVRVSLAPAPQEALRLLKPGTEVDVTGSTTLLSTALLIPSEAVRTDSKGPYVFVLAGDTVRRRGIRTGHAFADITQVLSGLQPGERVIISAPDDLADGARVRVRGTGP